jgi:hypothetical protein
MKDRPDNMDTPSQRRTKEQAVSAAFLQYLAGTGPFRDFRNEQEAYEKTMVQFPYSSKYTT